MNIPKMQCADGEIIEVPRDFAQDSSLLVMMAKDMDETPKFRRAPSMELRADEDANDGGDDSEPIIIPLSSAVLRKAMSTNTDRRSWSDDEVMQLASVGDYFGHKPLLEATVQELGRRELVHENPNLVALTGQYRAYFIDVKGQVRSACGGYWGHYDTAPISLAMGEVRASVHQQPNVGGAPTSREGNKADVSVERVVVSPGHRRVKFDFTVSRKVQGFSIISLQISGKLPTIDAQSKTRVSVHLNALSDGKGTRKVIANLNGQELLGNIGSPTDAVEETLEDERDATISGTDLELDVRLESCAGGFDWPPTHDHLAPQRVHGSLTVDVEIFPRFYPILNQGVLDHL